MSTNSAGTVNSSQGQGSRVAFQGEAGAYSEAALIEYSEWRGLPVPEPVPCESFDLIFEKVSQGLVEFGFIPIENSLAGSIHRNYDLLLQNNLWVIGEYHLRVSHCLLACPGSEMRDIKRVISHPQALAQCDGFLRKWGVEVEAAYDTAGSAKIVSHGEDCTTAAIASRRAADIYGLNILAQGIEDNPANYTRFLMIAPEAVDTGEDAKTSVVFSLKNVPGSLFRGMGAFALRDIDLTKIESRPLAGKPWEYFFYIDFAGSTKDLVVQRALGHLEELALYLRILGSYPRHQLVY
jgi:prephenate dehydratase